MRNLTHMELAQHLHVYRESATAALAELKRARIIETGGSEFEFSIARVWNGQRANENRFLCCAC